MKLDTVTGICSKKSSHLPPQRARDEVWVFQS